MIDSTDCKGCQRSAAAQVPEREVVRLMAEFLTSHPGSRIADDRTYADRTAACRACPDVRFGGTTCRHCGCMVALRAKLLEKGCPAPTPRWNAFVS